MVCAGLLTLSLPSLAPASWLGEFRASRPTSCIAAGCHASGRTARSHTASAAASGDVLMRACDKDGLCHESPVPRKYVRYAAMLYSLQEGSCADLGFSDPAGSRSFTVPGVGAFHLESFRRSNVTTGQDGGGS